MMRADLRRMTPDERSRYFKRHGIATTCSLQGVGDDGRCALLNASSWWQCMWTPLGDGWCRNCCWHNHARLVRHKVSKPWRI